MQKDRKTLFVIDGYGQIYRSYYAFMTNPLRDRNGRNISAVYGFFSTLISLVRQYRPDYLAVALDSRGKTFRHELFPPYKSNRDKTPQDLHEQVDRIRTMLDQVHIKSYAIRGMEADDIIATLACGAARLGVTCVMVTGDKDLLQLVNDNTLALRPPKKGEREWALCDGKAVSELYGVGPEAIVDYLTILGDSSDFVPGIDGIGEKGAVGLLSRWGSLDNVYANIDSISGSLRTKLENGREKVPLSRTLIQLKSDLFTLTGQELDEAACGLVNWENAVSVFAGLGSERLVSAAARMLPAGTDIAALKRLGNTVGAAGTANTVGAANAGNADDAGKSEVAGGKGSAQLPADCIAGYDFLGENPDGKRQLDLMIAAWMLDSNAGHYELDELCLKYLGEMYPEKDKAVQMLAPVIYSQLVARKLDSLYFNMEMPLGGILHRMEKRGILLDSGKLEEFGKELSAKCVQIEQDVHTLCGHPFNLNSPKQLQEVLFVERELPTGKKNQSGFSTSSDVLEDLASTTDDPVPGLVLQYRMLSKLLNTYISPLPAQADSRGRIHTTFLQTGTSTGRLSSKNPNLQNIPIRTDEGRRIRDAFVAPQGCVLLSADYSQIELAVLAHVSGDPELRRAFINGEDVHRETAALIFNIFPDFVTPAQRRIAKTINFGVIYGMSAFRLSRDLGITRKDAQGFIDTYFEKYSGVSAFIEKTIRQARESGWTSTAMGHMRRIDDINSVNRTVRQAAERMAVNSVIQGSAAEIMKIAMISIDKRLEEDNLESALLLQVHDEVILEVPEAEIEPVTDLVRSCMINAVKLSIPLRVGIETGKSWGVMH